MISNFKTMSVLFVLASLIGAQPTFAMKKDDSSDSDSEGPSHVTLKITTGDLSTPTDKTPSSQMQGAVVPPASIEEQLKVARAQLALADEEKQRAEEQAKKAEEIAQLKAQIAAEQEKTATANMRIAEALRRTQEAETQTSSQPASVIPLAAIQEEPLSAARAKAQRLLAQPAKKKEKKKHGMARFGQKLDHSAQHVHEREENQKLFGIYDIDRHIKKGLAKGTIAMPK